MPASSSAPRTATNPSGVVTTRESRRRSRTARARALRAGTPPPARPPRPRRELLRGRDDAVVALLLLDVFGAGIERRHHQLVLVCGVFGHQDDPLPLEEVRD